MFQQPFLPPPFFHPERIIRREMEGEINQPDLEPKAESQPRQEDHPPFSLFRWLSKTLKGVPALEFVGPRPTNPATRSRNLQD